MNRCFGCGMFFDGDECPGDHSHIETYWPPERATPRLCATCGRYFRGGTCPNSHEGVLVDKALITLGNAVTCDVSGIWTDLETVPGLLVGVDGDSYRVIVALPGEQGGTAALTLPPGKVS